MIIENSKIYLRIATYGNLHDVRCYSHISIRWLHYCLSAFKYIGCDLKYFNKSFYTPKNEELKRNIFQNNVVLKHYNQVTLNVTKHYGLSIEKKVFFCLENFFHDD